MCWASKVLLLMKFSMEQAVLLQRQPDSMRGGGEVIVLTVIRVVFVLVCGFVASCHPSCLKVLLLAWIILSWQIPGTRHMHVHVRVCLQALKENNNPCQTTGPCILCFGMKAESVYCLPSPFPAM